MNVGNIIVHKITGEEAVIARFEDEGRFVVLYQRVKSSESFPAYGATIYPVSALSEYELKPCIDGFNGVCDNVEVSLALVPNACCTFCHSKKVLSKVLDSGDK